MEGWLKLHRSLIESSVFQDAEVLKIWIYLLCNAAYYEHDVIFNGSVIPLKCGQIPTGRKKIAQQTGMLESRVYRALNILKKLGNIEMISNNKVSIITIVNWDKFQIDAPKSNSKLTANQHQTNSKSTASQQQTYTTKERKERKEIKKLNKEPEILIHPNSGLHYVVIDGDMVDLDGRKLNEAGYPIINFNIGNREL